MASATGSTDGPRSYLTLRVPVAVTAAGLAAAAALYLAAGSEPLAVFGGAIAAGLTAALMLRPVALSVRQVAGALNRAANAAEGPPALSEMEELRRAAEAVEARLAASASASSHDRNQLLAALNSGADAFFGVDAEGAVRFANLAAERLFGRPRELMAGRHFASLMPDPEAVEALRAGQDTRTRQVRSLERPNKQFLEVSVTPIADGGDWSALVVFHDLTDVKRAEQMRRDFVANVSHELRTPLASIRAVLETLETGALADPAAARDFIARAQTEVDRLTAMVAELLELSRIESGEFPMSFEPVGVGNAVTEAVERLRSQADRLGVRMCAEIEPGIELVLGDSERIERAVVNLVQNALKFSQPGGEVRVSATQSEGIVRIAVSDNGAGIDQRDLSRIFERFYKADNSRRTDGSGLGLALVKHTAEAHGGSVSVASELGHGSTFTISLPALAERPATAGQQP